MFIEDITRHAVSGKVPSYPEYNTSGSMASNKEIKVGVSCATEAGTMLFTELSGSSRTAVVLDCCIPFIFFFVLRAVGKEKQKHFIKHFPRLFHGFYTMCEMFRTYVSIFILLLFGSQLDRFPTFPVLTTGSQWNRKFNKNTILVELTMLESLSCLYFCVYFLVLVTPVPYSFVLMSLRKEGMKEGRRNVTSGVTACIKKGKDPMTSQLIVP